MKIDTPTRVAKSLPPEILDVLGPPPILSTEESKLYYATFGYFANDIVPDDMITWMLLKDLADHRTEIARYRRLKSAVLQKAHSAQVRRNVAQLKANQEAELNALRLQGDADRAAVFRTVTDPQAREQRTSEISQQLEAKMTAKRDGFSAAIRICEQRPAHEQDLVFSLDEWIVDHQRIDRLLELAEQRFLTTRREIERHVSGFGRELREKFRKVIDGEVIEAETESVAPQQIGKPQPAGTETR